MGPPTTRTHGFLPRKKAPVGIHGHKSDSKAMDYTMKLKCHFRHTVHCKKKLSIFPSPARTLLTKLSMARNNQYFSRPGRVWSVTSRLGTGKSIIFFTVYTVESFFQYLQPLRSISCNLFNNFSFVLEASALEDRSVAAVH